jgi:hypothetical protein
MYVLGSWDSFFNQIRSFICPPFLQTQQTRSATTDLRSISSPCTAIRSLPVILSSSAACTHISVLCFSWNFLNGIPMLKVLSVRIKSKEIHRDGFFVVWPHLMSV